MNTVAKAGLAVVLVETRNPLNIGAVARAMSNFGFFELRLVRPYEPSFREAVSAVGAAPVMAAARVFDSVAEAVADCTFVAAATGLSHREPSQPAYRLERAGRLLRRHLQSARAAILFGSEKHGLGNEHLQFAQMLLHIPTRAEHESMNLAQAVAVTLYELIRQPAMARSSGAEAERAGSAALERATLLLEEVLQTAGHTDYGQETAATLKTHEFVRRLNLSARDAAILTGMLRQIRWKLKES
jgi:tRNA/rRNA methyltransferase